MLHDSSLIAFEQKLSEHVIDLASTIGLSHPKFIELIGSVAENLNSPSTGSPLSESSLRILEGAAGMLGLRERWIPDVRVYDRWIDCLPEIVGGLGHRFAEEWRDFSVATVDQLLLPRLRFADGVELVREWVSDVRCFQRAIRTPGVEAFSHEKLTAAPRGQPPAMPAPQEVNETDEVSTAEAAGLLGVSKHTVIGYIKAGMLEYRNAAKPASTIPRYRIRLRSVLELRRTYKCDVAAPHNAIDASRRRRIPPAKPGGYRPKHLRLQRP